MQGDAKLHHPSPRRGCSENPRNRVNYLRDHSLDFLKSYINYWGKNETFEKSDRITSVRGELQVWRHWRSLHIYMDPVISVFLIYILEVPYYMKYEMDYI